MFIPPSMSSYFSSASRERQPNGRTQATELTVKYRVPDGEKSRLPPSSMNTYRHGNVVPVAGAASRAKMSQSVLCSRPPGRHVTPRDRGSHDSPLFSAPRVSAATESSGLAGFGLASVVMSGAEGRQARFPSGFEDSQSR